MESCEQASKTKESTVKRILLLIIAIGVAASGLSALGIGGAFSTGIVGNMPNSAMISLKLDKLPLLGFGFSIGSGQTDIGLTADWWFYHEKVGGPFSVYIGAGGYGEYNNGTFGLGARLPIGLQFFPLKPLELFIEAAPRAGLALGNPIQFPVWGVQAAVGFRVWTR